MIISFKKPNLEQIEALSLKLQQALTHIDICFEILSFEIGPILITFKVKAISTRAYNSSKICLILRPNLQSF